MSNPIETPVYHTVMPEASHRKYIRTVLEFVQNLAAGPYAWPGGYPIYFICADNGVLSFAAAKEMELEIISAITDGYDKQWQVVALEINWEDPDLYCDHTDQRIESAYAEPEENEPAHV